MKAKAIIATFFLVAVSTVHLGYAQEAQVPNIYLNNKTNFTCSANVHIDARTDFLHSGDFYVEGIGNSSPPYYPDAKIAVKINMSDSLISYFECTSVEAMSSTGKHTPMAFVMGRCKTNVEQFVGCHFWIKFTDNKISTSVRNSDIITFLVLDGNGKRLAYGSGVVNNGDIFVESTSN